MPRANAARAAEGSPQNSKRPARASRLRRAGSDAEGGCGGLVGGGVRLVGGGMGVRVRRRRVPRANAEGLPQNSKSLQIEEGRFGVWGGVGGVRGRLGGAGWQVGERAFEGTCSRGWGLDWRVVREGGCRSAKFSTTCCCVPPKVWMPLMRCNVNARPCTPSLTSSSRTPHSP